MIDNPHSNGAVHHFGEPLKTAKGAVVLLHGRGGSAEDILLLGQEMFLPGIAYLAPQATDHTWYPYSFLAPRTQNEPWLSSALQKVKATVQQVKDAGIPAEKIVLAGFSQGACLSTEFVASNPQRYGGLIAFTGGLIGPEGSELTHTGDLAGTPVFFGTGDPDPHVPFSRVQESAKILTAMGASVTTRRYELRPHTITREEIEFGKRLLEGAFTKA
ncbi:MAG: dienelactone hydrolase family protein [Edaphobacter sp.]|uniref:alpha/beta hydrolase n=1 Tax=Edaphobacter sp. TaxID=1934404 RepID=UPI0023A34D16|nr:dienelactone hydrolase family protein [Edaphobacter sp.]MDE1177811.1 dienelactone hydrolase family protein [Edaphobacter sp.]